MKDTKGLDEGEVTEIVVDDFENVTENEIMGLFRCFVSKDLSENEVWHAIAASMLLDMAFGRSHKLINVRH